MFTCRTRRHCYPSWRESFRSFLHGSLPLLVCGVRVRRAWLSACRRCRRAVCPALLAHRCDCLLVSALHWALVRRAMGGVVGFAGSASVGAGGLLTLFCTRRCDTGTRRSSASPLLPVSACLAGRSEKTRSAHPCSWCGVGRSDWAVARVGTCLRACNIHGHRVCERRGGAGRRARGARTRLGRRSRAAQAFSTPAAAPVEDCGSGTGAPGAPPKRARVSGVSLARARAPNADAAGARSGTATGGARSGTATGGARYRRVAPARRLLPQTTAKVLCFSGAATPGSGALGRAR